MLQISLFSLCLWRILRILKISFCIFDNSKKCAKTFRWEWVEQTEQIKNDQKIYIFDLCAGCLPKLKDVCSALRSADIWLFSQDSLRLKQKAGAWILKSSSVLWCVIASHVPFKVKYLPKCAFCQSDPLYFFLTASNVRPCSCWRVYCLSAKLL